jgi:hypothetical protein
MAREPFKYGRRLCIFCGEPGKISKEHIWPKWLRDYISFDADSHIMASTNVYPDRHEIIMTKKVDGDARNRGVSVVCERCNSGWMGALQERVKPFLVPVIHGRGWQLSVLDQIALSTWVTMAIMVGEHFFKGSLAVPVSERRALMTTCRPLENWKIWAGTYERKEWLGHLGRNTRFLLFPGSSAPQDGQVPAPNTHTTTFVVGKALFHAFGCPLPEQTAVVRLRRADGALVEIWPPTEGTFIWPTPALTDEDAAGLTDVIFSWIDALDKAEISPECSPRTTHS